MVVNDSVIRWGIILVLAIGLFAIRLSFVELIGQFARIPPRFNHALRLVPAAVLAALVFPDLILLNGAPVIGVGNHRLIAGVIAGVVAWRTESIIGTLGVGMISLWVLEYLFL